MTKNTNPNTPRIMEMVRSGEYTQAYLAGLFNLSKQRIAQIVKKAGGGSVVDFKRKKKEEEHFLKWGSRDTSDLYAACRVKYFHKKANATKAGHEFTIPFGHIEWVPTCPILGLELDYFAEKTQENSPSFDRLDPTKGYVSGNVQIVSWRANRIKNDGTSEEHERIAQYIRERQEIL
jgi:hypothetical protein